MTNTTLPSVLGPLLGLVGLLCGLALAGVGFISGIKADAWSKRSRYVLWGGIFGFLFGVSGSALLFMGAPDLRVLPILLKLSLGCGLGGAFLVFYSMWSSRWWRRYSNRAANRATEENGKDV